MNRFRNRVWQGSLGLVLVTMLLLAGNALAQDNADSYPPHVIDVWPYPGEEVLVDQPVTVTFDQEMNRVSVEAAWLMEPAAGTDDFRWLDDRTLTFMPDGGWQRASRYDIQLGTAAKAANGLPLEETYQFHVQTIGYLTVSTVIPAPDATGVAADATITLSFDRPVVPLVSTEQLDDLPQPVIFEPNIEGTGEWINTSIYQFTPGQPLAGGTTYTASVPAGLTDVTGAVLENTYQWQFKTLAPEILNVTPLQNQAKVRLESTIAIQFSQPMDIPSTQEALLVLQGDERVPGSITWSDEDRWLTFTPEAPLKMDSTYSIRVAPSARGAAGDATLEAGITYTFNTVPYPGIDWTDPANDEQSVEPGNRINIRFKSPMNTDTFEDKVEIIQPEGVEWTPVVYEAQDGATGLYLDVATLPETTYTIRFKQGAEDVYGHIIEADYTFTFQTGKVDPWAYLPANNQFVITNAYRDHTRIAMNVEGQPTVEFGLYQVDTQQLGVLIEQYYYDDVSIVAKPANLVRLWSQTLDAGPTQRGIDEVLLAAETGGQLPFGVYFLAAQVPDYDDPQWLGLGVVNANVTLKCGPDEALVWVTDIESAEPVANTTVSLYSVDGSLFASGQTNGDGIFRTPVDTAYINNDEIYAIAESEGVYGVWWSWAPNKPDTAGYVYTDRPIYRPGQTVYFRGVMRDRDDMTYHLPGAETVHVTIEVNWGEQQLFDDDIPLSEFGTFDGELELSEDVHLGEAEIRVRYRHAYDAQVYFTIAEFRVPEYKVDVTPDYSEIIQGDPIKSMAAASYYFGGPVSNADLAWTIYGQPAWFNYTGPGYYHFADETQDYFYRTDLGSGSEQTNASGQVILETTHTQAPSVRPMTITMEAQVVDESGQYIAGRTSILVHPANVYVGMRTDRYFGREDIPVTVDLITVTPESEPLTGQQVALEVMEVRWERVEIEDAFGQYNWERKEIPVETKEVVTGEDGLAHYTFTPPQGGIYRVRAVTRDERERVNSSTLSLWVMGDNAVWWGRPSSSIDLVADQDTYQVGDTAEILVPIPFTGVSYVLVTVERTGIQHVEVVQVEGSTLVYKLPITAEHVPTIHFSVTLMKGTDAENLNPAFRTGALALNVEPAAQRLAVTITPSATRAQPGDTVTFDVKTMDAHGEPVSAEVGITLTDLAILSLVPSNSGSLESAFYGYQYNNVYTEVALEALLDVMTDEFLKHADRRDWSRVEEDAPDSGAYALGGVAEGLVETESSLDALGDSASDEQAPPPIREDFQQTPLWAPRVVTDATGTGTVSVALPDNLTTWHLDARGLTVNTQVGDAELDVMSTLPLLTRPVTPRFLVVGDRVTLASVINNNTDAPQDIQATLEATGVTFESAATQTVTIDAGQRARVEWVVSVNDVPFVDLTFFAVGEDGYADASKPTLGTGPDGTIPVYRYTAPDTVGTGGILREPGARTEAISLPPRLDTDQGELTVHIDPSLAVTTVDALDYLANFKHQCTEQTISRFLPNVMTFRALHDLGLDDPLLEADLRVVLDWALTKLANEQHSDGGWGWFSHMESNPYITAYAALGLIEAREAGFDIDAAMLDAALNFVRGYFVQPTIDTPVWQLNRQAFYRYVFARAGRVSQFELDTVLDHRLEMDYWARAFLLMAYHEFNPTDPAVAQLVSDLQTAAILSATGAHWEEDEVDWWNWSSQTRTTAIVLGALTRVQPESDLLPNAVRWLMVARQGDHWETTQETAWAVMALTDWMVATGELQGNYDYAVTLNQEVLTEGNVTPDTVREGAVLRVAVKDLLLDEANRLTFVRGEGEGVLYYTAHLKLRLWASEAKPINRGVAVSREYFLADKPDTPVSAAQMGDVITVRVTMNLSQDIYYFVLEDPIPAGTEPVDTSLLTASRTIDAPIIQPTYNPYWYWGWWLFDHTEMRDEQVNLYADFLPRGTYVYTYQVRATVPGEFQTMPSHAYAFYFPEVFGRGAGSLFTVTAAEE